MAPRVAERAARTGSTRCPAGARSALPVADRGGDGNREFLLAGVKDR